MTRIKREAFPAGQPEISDDDAIALYTAARGFLVGEWIGAALLILSFTQLYLAVAGHFYSGAASLIVGAFLGLTGAMVFWRSRGYYLRLEVAFGRRSHAIATVTAGAGGIFWLLFLLLVVLVWNGFPVAGQ